MTKTSVVYAAKVELADGMVAPDAWDESLGLVPPDDFVVSRHRDGTVASVYGDPSWNRTPYQPQGRTDWLHFTSWWSNPPSPQQVSLSGEMRYLMFLLIWKRPGNPLSNSSLDNYINAFRRLAQFSDKNSCRIQDVLNSTEMLVEFVEDDVPGGLLVSVKSMLKLLLKLGADDVGFRVLGTNVDRILNTHIGRYKDDARQYAPIPTRVYSQIISAMSAELKDWEDVADRYLALVKDCLDDPLLGKYKTVQIGLATKHGIARVPGEYRPEFEDLLQKYDLARYFDAHGLVHSTVGLTRGLSYVMTVAKLYIVTFTGMRNAEAGQLPYCCLETETGSGKVHCLVAGRTTKLNRVRTKWVTNAEGHRAIRLVQRIADVIYSHLGDTPTDVVTRLNRYPLFVSPSYLGFVGHQPKGDRGVWHSLSFGFFRKSYSSFRSKFQPVIDDTDLCELEQVDPHRAWRSEDNFQVGQPWCLTDHQLRRSLALYAQRSGLVSLPSLRRQLQHITEEMARYYARGSVFAKNFIGGDKDHFGLEWQDAGPTSSALAYIRDVLFSAEPVFGAHVKWINHRLDGSDGLIFMDRDATMRRFRNGEIAYKETPIGGCTKVGPCDEVAIRFLDVDCLGGCPNLVGKVSKLERVIKAQAALVNKLKPDTIEWRTETADLNVLIATRDKLRQQPLGE